MFAGSTGDARRDEVHEELPALVPLLKASPREYRHFGPYWWAVKRLLRDLPGSRAAWFRGPSRDTTVTVGDMDPQDLAWVALVYYRRERVEDHPAEFHIIEHPAGRVEAYRLVDGDAAGQLSLFPDDLPQPAASGTPGTPVYTGGAWMVRGEELAQRGAFVEAAAAFRRAASRSRHPRDSATAWIRLGQLFQEHHHSHKALFCYYNAWEREKEGWIHGLVAAVYLELGLPEEALRCYHMALEDMPGNPEYRAGVEQCRALMERAL